MKKKYKIVPKRVYKKKYRGVTAKEFYQECNKNKLESYKSDDFPWKMKRVYAAMDTNKNCGFQITIYYWNKRSNVTKKHIRHLVKHLRKER